MIIRSQKREGNRVALEIEEDYALFLAALEKSLQAAGREMSFPGFRPGKAPREMVEKTVNREAVEAHAAQELISTLYPQIIAEAKIEPVDYPSIEIVQQKKRQPFIFKLQVEVYPEVKLGKYKGIKVEKKPVQVTEEEIIKVLGNLQERFATTSAEGKKELLPLDDELAKKVSRFGTLAELKAELREAMLKDRAAEAEADLKNKIIAAAAAETKTVVPAGLVEREITIMLDELRGSLAQNNFTLEDYLKGIKKEEKELKEELRKSAEIRTKSKLVLRAVAEAEKLKVDESDIEVEISRMAAESGQPLAELKKRVDAGVKGYLEDYLRRQKALDFIVAKAEVKEAK
jgi:FKBP-type peptidyl-prolyl cis-trans isomerase (trigger factor)